MNHTYKVVDGKSVLLSDAEKGALKDRHEASQAREAARELERLAREARKSEILDKLKITRDEWQILLQGD